MPYSSQAVGPEFEGVRADKGVAEIVGISRTRAAAALQSGNVQLDGKVIGKSDSLISGQLLEVSWELPAEPVVVAREIPDMHIVYSDADLVVVDKPVGIVAHPATSWHGDTVLGGLEALGITVATSGPPERQGIVQRLDVGTSGLMMVAKSEAAYSRLKQMFRDHEVHKTYNAIVQGLPDPVAGTIDAPVGRHPKRDWKFAVQPDGKRSVTHYELLEAFAYASLMEIQLETGRTHQIRVHFSYLHHPLVGDVLYGADPTLASKVGIQRPALHAQKLAFTHPISGKKMEFEAPYRDDFQHALDVLGNFE